MAQKIRLKRAQTKLKNFSSNLVEKQAIGFAKMLKRGMVLREKSIASRPDKSFWLKNSYFIVNSQGKRVGTIAWAPITIEELESRGFQAKRIWAELKLPEKVAEIGQVSMLSEFQQKGYGEMAMQAIEAALKRKGLQALMLETNTEPMTAVARKLSYSLIKPNPFSKDFDLFIKRI
jgi:ribosomal protein S18 acetylase RimI-like enzyme